MSPSLRSADIELHRGLGISVDLLAGAHIRRVTDVETRQLLSSRHLGDLAGIAYPYLDPQTGAAVTCRVRRDHPEIENGKPRAFNPSHRNNPNETGHETPISIRHTLEGCDASKSAVAVDKHSLCYGVTLSNPDLGGPGHTEGEDASLDHEAGEL